MLGIAWAENVLISERNGLCGPGNCNHGLTTRIIRKRRIIRIYYSDHGCICQGLDFLPLEQRGVHYKGPSGLSVLTGEPLFTYMLSKEQTIGISRDLLSATAELSPSRVKDKHYLSASDRNMWGWKGHRIVASYSKTCVELGSRKGLFSMRLPVLRLHLIYQVLKVQLTFKLCETPQTPRVTDINAYLDSNLNIRDPCIIRPQTSQRYGNLNIERFPRLAKCRAQELPDKLGNLLRSLA